MKAKHTAYFVALCALTSLFACSGDDEINGGPDEPGPSSGGTSSSSGSTSSSGGSSSGDPTLPLTLQIDLAAQYDAATPKDASSFGYADATDGYDGGTSWRFHPTPTGPDGQKFEFYIPMTAPDAGVTVEAELARVHAHLGDVKLSELASVKLRSRRHGATTQDFTLLVYTTTDGTSDDASWYGQRLHAPLSASANLNAPDATWNTFSTDDGDNSIRFWDYRHANLAEGVAPNDNLFSLADIAAGPVQPAGVDSARDYRERTIKYLTIASNSGQTTLDASLDAIELELRDGRKVILDLAGDANFRQYPVSLAALAAADYNSGTNSFFGTASQTAPAYGGFSWAWSKDDTPANTAHKFEFHVPFGAADTTFTNGQVWDEIRGFVGPFTIAQLERFSVVTKRADETPILSTAIYTLEGATENDATWYRRLLLGSSSFLGAANVPADTWTSLSTDGADNQLKFWDTRKNTANTAVPFTLAEAQGGPISVGGVERSYAAETVKYLTFTSYSGTTAHDLAVDKIEIKANGKTVRLDLTK